MPVLRRFALDRRTLLRGGAAALALPWLDAMAPALTTPPKAPVRSLFVFSPNGMNVPEWRPRGDGPDAKFEATLAPLQPLRARVSVFRGLAIDAGFAHGDGPGDHARAASTYLTCAHPRKTGGADIHVGVSIDQQIAAAVGGATAFASLELGMERGAAAGICDSGYSCAYSNNVSWRTPNVPVAKETEPRAVFTRLFGDPQQASDAAAQAAEQRTRRSLLDLVAGDAKALRGSLGSADRQKLEQFLTSVRELEQRLQRVDQAEPQVAVPGGLLERGGYAEKLALMYELVALAFATDKTRVVTLMLGNGGSNRSYKFLGVPDGHHDLSHHGRKEEKLAALAKINRFQVEQLAVFLKRLANQRDGDGDLLRQSLVVFGSGLGDGDRHNHDDLPVLLAGRGGGTINPGRVIDTSHNMADLFLAMAARAGCVLQSHGDSKKMMEGLS